MNMIRIALSSFAVLGLTGCASLQVRTDYNAQASFAQLKTYNWINQPVGVAGDPALSGGLRPPRSTQEASGFCPGAWDRGSQLIRLTRRLERIVGDEFTHSIPDRVLYRSKSISQ